MSHVDPAKSWVALGFGVLAASLIVSGCSREASDFQLDDPPGLVDSALVTLGGNPELFAVAQMDGSGPAKETTLADIYSGSGAGFVVFDSVGSSAVIYGEPRPNGSLTRVSLLDLTSGKSTQVMRTEKCGAGVAVVFAVDSQTLVEHECDRARLRRSTPNGWVLTGAEYALDDSEAIEALSSDGRILTRGHNRFRVRLAATGALMADYPNPPGISSSELEGAVGTFDEQNRPLVVTGRGVWQLGSTERPRLYAANRCQPSCRVDLAGWAPGMIAWTIAAPDSGGSPELWTLDAAGVVTKRGTVAGSSPSDYVSFFVAERLLRPGPDFLDTPYLHK